MYEPVCRVLYFIQSIPVGEQVAGITVTMATIWAPHLYVSFKGQGAEIEAT